MSQLRQYQPILQEPRPPRKRKLTAIRERGVFRLLAMAAAAALALVLIQTL